MILSDYFHCYESVLSEEFCNKVIEIGKSKISNSANIGDYSQKSNITKKEEKEIKSIRDSNISWLTDSFIFKEIQPLIFEANKKLEWNWDWDCSETAQFTAYKKNQFYDWHTDSFIKPYDRPNNPNIHGKIRKISVTCSLNDGSEYEGGELELDFRNKPDGKSNIETCDSVRSKGSVIVFPSFMWHRVRPITKGTRYSLVIWSLGKPFK